jgi:hypothetical protein
MKKIFLVFFILCSVQLFSQKTFTDCSFLVSAVKTSIFKNFFYIEKNPLDTLYISDSNNLFKDCRISDSVSGRRLIFSKKYINKGINSIKIYRIDILNANKRKIYFYCPYTGGALILTMYKKKDNFKLIEHTSGAF